MKRFLPFILIAAVVAGALAAGVWMYQTQSTPAQTAAPATETTAASSKPISGAVLVEEFGDYQCPPCGAFHPEMNKIKAEYGDKIRFVFRHFPLSQIHPNARAAAHAAVAAGKQGKFWEMHNMLYENQNFWAELPDITPIVTSYAQKLGLDVNKFSQDLNANDVSSAVYGDYQLGISMGVTGTPTVFLNGQQLTNEEMTPENIREEINKRLKG
ncbi:MAG: DsbA family protein [Blastocatellales bacterium]